MFLEKRPMRRVVCEDIPGVLQEMKQSKKNLFIVTDRDTETARKLAEDGGILDCFEDVHGTAFQGEFIAWADIFRRFRDNQMIKNAHNINPSNTIMILSSTRCIRVAHHLGFLVIGVMSDDAIPSELMDAGANVVVPFPGSVSHAVIMVENLRKNVVSSEPKAEKLQHA
jgi:phosphoglycolate phosphatase-like HAD superfamily hydrolase